MKPEANSRRRHLHRRIWAVALALAILPGAAEALADPSPIAASEYDSSVAMIRMRDGVRLHTEILVPKTATGPLPIILLRTPYGAANFIKPPKELARDGYIFVAQDIRGKYKSEGQFVMFRPMVGAGSAGGIDEGTDAYDTIDWLVRNIKNNNGRVGMHGVSYAAWLAHMAAINPHPALKAVSPQGSPADMYVGDDFFHNGAFRLNFGFEYVAAMERGKELRPYEFDRFDLYDWYRELGPISNAGSKIPTRGTFWELFATHRTYDEFWRSLEVPSKLGTIEVPTLNVGGWFDQEDGYGPLANYQALRNGDRKGLNYLAVGPWNHGGWRNEGRTLGAIDFGSATGQEFRGRILAPWFAHYLKGAGTGNLPKVQMFRTGCNQWRTMDDWQPHSPPARKRLYFGPAGTLSPQPAVQTAADLADRFISDPNRPVPFHARPIRPITDKAHPGETGWSNWMVADQRFADGRPDVLTYVSPPLEEDLIVTGEITAKFWASTSETDADWIVKLIDVFPDEYPSAPRLGGYQMLLSGEVLRARYRNSLSHPEPVPAGDIVPYEISLRQRDHCFLKGHRLMIQVQSSWFPVIDRNPQSFVSNIFEARESDFRPATQTVFRSALYPSHVDLPIAR
jgi:putative CocE/NonD family hydrolase